ncbi:MAG: hypothetical protein ACFFDF_08850 [Candidatus Odinarchaeota archaeon]
MEILSEESLNNSELYSERRLQHLAHDQIWKGKGIETDPFLVENANILGQAFLIKKSSLHISFVNCNFEHAQFESCKNILLKHCTFKTLLLHKSEKFNISNCYISNLKFSRTNEVNFRNCIISDVSQKFRIKRLIFERCQINNQFLEDILKKQNSGFYSKIKDIIGSYIIIMLLFMFYRLFWTPYDLNNSDLNILLLMSSIIIVSLLVLSFLSFCEYLTKKKRPRIIISDEKIIKKRTSFNFR